MLVPILPFFLAAQVAIDPSRQSEWAMYGGECTYDVFVVMSPSNIARADDNFCSSIKSELKCRPKGQDSLSCHFQNSRIRHSSPKESNCTHAMDFVPTRTRFVGEEPFEIRFNPRGIQNLVVPGNIPRWQLDMIRAIVSHLNVGFEVLERRDRFTIMENTTMSHCEVDVKFIHDSSEEDDDDDHDDEKDDSVEKEDATKQDEKGEDFEIQFVSANDKPTRTLDEKFHAQKLRKPKSCPQRTIYFFGDEGDYSRGNHELYLDMTDSVSHIIIEKNEFLSFTLAAGIIKTANKSQVTRPQQHIKMKLKQIDLARNSLPEIRNPVSMSL